MENLALKTLRTSIGMSQFDFGLEVGLDKETAQARISHYETGRRGLPFPVAVSVVELAKAHKKKLTFEQLYQSEPNVRP